MGHHIYVLLCSEIIKSGTWLGRFSKKIGTSSKVKFFQNPFCHILETLDKNYHKKYFFGYHDALKIYRASKLCSEIIKSGTYWEFLIFSILFKVKRH